MKKKGLRTHILSHRYNELTNGLLDLFLILLPRGLWRNAYLLCPKDAFGRIIFFHHLYDIFPLVSDLYPGCKDNASQIRVKDVRGGFGPWQGCKVSERKIAPGSESSSRSLVKFLLKCEFDFIYLSHFLEIIM